MIDNDNDNDGERELVLGNRQLLGIFFVATLLCGVFFAMGYVVGGNSARAGAAATAATADNASAPVADGKHEEPQPPQQSTVPADTADNSAAGDGSSFPDGSGVADSPDEAGAQPAAALPEAPAPVPAHSASPAKSPATVPAAAETGVSLSVPEAGASYWQVAAPTRPAADVLVKQLRDRQLPAILAKSSKPGLFEVLVGPYRSTLTLADAKKKLTDLGFDGLIIHK